MKKDLKSLEDMISKLKELDNSQITYGIYGKKAQMVDKDPYNKTKSRGIKFGLLARVLEEGRAIIHRGGVIHFVNHAGEEKYYNIPAGKVLHIPPRPFFTYANNDLKKDIPKIFKTQFLLLIKNKNSVDNLLKQMGQVCKDTIVKKIINSWFLPIGPLQEWKKGHNNPLFDTGGLVNSVDYKVKK